MVAERSKHYGHLSFNGDLQHGISVFASLEDDAQPASYARHRVTDMPTSINSGRVYRGVTCPNISL